jgi:hypothetical protein
MDLPFLGHPVASAPSLGCSSSWFFTGGFRFEYVLYLESEGAASMKRVSSPALEMTVCNEFWRLTDAGPTGSDAGTRDG